MLCVDYKRVHSGFNTQPPEGGWHVPVRLLLDFQSVSTHSRLKAAGNWGGLKSNGDFGFNTQPPEGGWVTLFSAVFRFLLVSTHSRLKAAGNIAINRLTHQKGFNTQPPEGGWDRRAIRQGATSCFNTQPPEGGWDGLPILYGWQLKFQHTAA